MDNDELVRQLTETAARSKSNVHRLDRLEERMDKLEVLSASIASMQVEMQHMLQTVQEIKDAVTEIQRKPGKWWEKLIAAILTAIVGYLLALVVGGSAV